MRLTERLESSRAEACLCAERRGDCKIEALTVSIFSDDLMGRGTPVLRRVVLPVCLNVVTHVTIDKTAKLPVTKQHNHIPIL